MKKFSKNKGILIIVIVILCVIAEFVILRIVLNPEIERTEEIRDQSKHIKDKFTLNPNEFESFKFKFEGGWGTHLSYEIDTNNSIIFLVLNKDGYDDLKENGTYSDIDDDDMFKDKEYDDEDEEKRGVAYAEDQAYIVVMNDAINYTKVKLEVFVNPSVPITPGYVAFFFLIAWINLIGIIILIVIITSYGITKDQGKAPQKTQIVPSRRISIETAKKLCPLCGHSIQAESARFCVNCGAKLLE